jgi:ABC-type branched-subunit amino acid transport system permease subunit
MRGRPNLYTDYSKESAIFSNNTQKVWFTFVIVFAISMCFLASEYWLLLLTTALLFSVACWGLNIVSGFAGQINLAHGFFMELAHMHPQLLGV